MKTFSVANNFSSTYLNSRIFLRLKTLVAYLPALLEFLEQVVLQVPELVTRGHVQFEVALGGVEALPEFAQHRARMLETINLLKPQQTLLKFYISL